MAKMTAKRLEKVRPILERYREELRTRHQFDAPKLEQEIKHCLDIHYITFKEIIIDLLKNERYKLVAARCMEKCAFPVVSEFKSPLAKLYGMDRYDDDDLDARRERFWTEALQSLAEQE